MQFKDPPIILQDRWGPLVEWVFCLGFWIIMSVLVGLFQTRFQDQMVDAGVDLEKYLWGSERGAFTLNLIPVITVW